MKLIVGLGNPGKEFERTRHNVGWAILDVLAGKEKWLASKKAQALYLKMEVNERRVELLKPTTFMNNSGLSVSYAMKNHSLTPADIVVVHDDKDVPLGEMRVQKNRGAAGHNGVQSIIDHLGTKDFTRIRVGVAPLDQHIANTADFVLGKFSKEEQKVLNGVTENVIKEIEQLIR